MNRAVINIKTDPQLKKEAQIVASGLGFSLSSLINAYLRQLTRTKAIMFSLETEEPSEYMIQALKQAEEDRKSGKTSPNFSKATEAISWLRDPNRTYES